MMQYRSSLSIESDVSDSMAISREYEVSTSPRPLFFLDLALDVGCWMSGGGPLI